MTLRPFFSYFGGKWRSAPSYPPPRHRHIVEPFAGSAGYALRHHQLQVTLVEKNEAVAGAWDFLIRATVADILALPLVPSGHHIDDYTWPCAEARDLVGLNINRGADAPRRSASRWGDPSRWRFNGWTEASRERVAQQVGSIRHWRIICADYTSAPDVEATWFIDSPYQSQPDKYRCRGRDLDYSQLSDWCRARSGQVIVCEGHGADWLPFEPFGQFQSNKRNSGRSRSAELIWMNAWNGAGLWVPGPGAARAKRKNGDRS